MKLSRLQLAEIQNLSTEKQIMFQAITKQVKEEIVTEIEEEAEVTRKNLHKIKVLKEGIALIIKEKTVIARRIYLIYKEVERKTKQIQTLFLRKELWKIL
jgi:hypothetical protein